MRVAVSEIRLFRHGVFLTTLFNVHLISSSSPAPYALVCFFFSFCVRVVVTLISVFAFSV